MCAESSEPRMAATAADLPQSRIKIPAIQVLAGPGLRLVDPLSELPATQQSSDANPFESIHIQLLEIITDHQRVMSRAFPKWSSRWRFNGKRVERSPSFISFKQYTQELEVVLKTSKDVQAYSNSYQAMRELVILYDDMTQVFDQNSEELRKNRDSRNGTIDPISVQACTGRAKSLRDRLEALLPTDTNTHGNV